ncbi:MAG: ABC transporter permease [Clostridia bacterium]|nr:ABC transporter permease [Clostridia bacterium]MBR2177348.1 ABC transporter permease [Clostridia bacterium]
MYFNILKRDLKRKKTMNVILLLFMILSVMFVSSSMNTVISVMSATDKYMDMSDAHDYFVATTGTQAGKDVEKNLDGSNAVKSYKSENIFYLSENAIEYNGKVLDNQATGILNSVDDISIKIFDENKNELTKVKDGEVYMKSSFMQNNHITEGSKIKIRSGRYTGEFTVKGIFLDVLFGSDMMGTPRFIISRNDFNKYVENNTDPAYDMVKGNILNIETDDTAAVENLVSDVNGVAFTGSRATIKLSYIMDMVIAGVFLVVSICLIIIALVLLKFTIGFTVSEEYREIGVMKAIGIKNSKIRTLYMVKYIAMAIVGAVIGFFCGIPFGNMMMAQSTRNFITGGGDNYLLNIVCSAAVVLIIAFFCWLSTNKVKKFTPVDAIRNGESGKRYKKKGILSLSKSKQKPIFFMALNDILSGFRHFAVMTVTFIVGILMITIILNTISTLQSSKLLAWFSMADCDITLEDKASTDKYTRTDGQTIRSDYLKEMETTLKENGMPAQCFAEGLFKLSVQSDSAKTVALVFHGIGSTADQYSYIEGTAPERTNEVALSYLTAEKLDVNIGDTITIKTNDENEKFIVTALYQCMNDMGEGARLSEKMEMDYSKALGYFSYQVRFTDNPSASEIQSRYDKIAELYPDYTIRTAGEYVDYSVGGIAGYMGDTKNFIIMIVMIINILVVVLMEKSFLTKERSEIALLKAIGFKNRSIITWQTLRIAILMVAAVIAAVILSEPIGQLAVGGIFKMMGSKYIIFDINIIETYIIYPLAVFAVTVLAALISALGVRGVSSSEVNNIE